AVVEVVARPGQRQRLERLRRRAHEAHEPGIAGLGDHRPVANRHRVHAMPGLDNRAPAYLDDYRVHLRAEPTSGSCNRDECVTTSPGRWPSPRLFAIVTTCLTSPAMSLLACSTSTRTACGPRPGSFVTTSTASDFSGTSAESRTRSVGRVSGSA